MIRALLQALRTDRAVLFAMLLVAAAHPFALLRDSVPALDVMLRALGVP